MNLAEGEALWRQWCVDLGEAAVAAAAEEAAKAPRLTARERNELAVILRRLPNPDVMDDPAPHTGAA